jgi:hypothetical protein
MLAPTPQRGPSTSVMPFAAQMPPKTVNNPHRGFGVFLSPVGYTLAHLGIHLLYAMCAAYFFLAGLVYSVLPETDLLILFSYNSLTIDPRFFDGVSIVHFVFAALFALLLLVAPVTALLQVGRRRMRCCRAGRSASLTASLLASVRGPRGLALLSARTRSSYVGRGFAYLYTRVMAYKGLFDVESQDYEMFFLVRELTETILQSQQAYMMNRLLPRQQLNRFYVTILVVNCWSTPLLHRFSRHDYALKRLLGLLLDLTLDFASVIGVSAWLARDYLADYDPRTGTFATSLYSNETWMIRLLNDMPQIAILTWFDAFSRSVFSLGMIAAIDDIKKLLKHKPANRVGVAPKSALTQRPTLLYATPTPRHEQLTRWAHRLMVFGGFLILAIHCHAELKSNPLSCALEIRPWLTPQPACALTEINCFTGRHLSGAQTEFEAIFQNLDTQLLLQIVVRHCVHVEFTPRLQTFHNLIGLKTYNSTLATWEGDAHFTHTDHPNLRNAYFIRTNFSNATLPEGLHTSQFSPRFWGLTISGSNLNRLPETLHEHWPTLLALYVEYAALTEFPMGLVELGAGQMSLSHSQIQELPPEAFQLKGLISFTGNPITTLPDHVDTSLVPLSVVLLDRSLVAHPLPLWIDEDVLSRLMLFLGGSPFCETVALNDSSAEYQELLLSRPWLVDGRVDCNIFEIFFYPPDIDVRETDGVMTS